MKNQFILVVAAVLLSAGNQFVAAEGDGIKVEIRPGGNPAGAVVLNPNPYGAGVVNAGGFGGKPAAAWYIENIEKTVPLTPAQKEAMTKIIEARDRAMQEFQAKNGEKLQAARKALTDAYQGKDKEAIAGAQKEFQETNAGASQIYQQAQTDLDNVLTAEQKTKRQEAMVAQMIKSLTDPAVLSDEQITQIKSLIAKESAEGGREGGERRERQWYQSIQDILTADQKAVIAKHRALSYTKMVLGRANLTAEQLQKIEGAYDELAKTPNLNGEAITKKLYEKSLALLTEEQKEGMKQGAWTGVAVGGPAPGQPLNRAPGAAQSSQSLKNGEAHGPATLAFTTDGVLVAGNGAPGGATSTWVIGEGRREMEKGPWLGIAMEPVSEPLAAQLPLAKGEGLLINHVIPNSPAAAAGLAQYDVLVRLDDQILVEPMQLKKLLAMKKPGDRVKLVYVHKAERKETSTTLVEHEIETAQRVPQNSPQMMPGQPQRLEPSNREMREMMERRDPQQPRQLKPLGAPLQPGAPLPPRENPPAREE